MATSDEFTISASPAHFDEIDPGLQKAYKSTLGFIKKDCEAIERKKRDICDRLTNSDHIASDLKTLHEVFSEGEFGQTGYDNPVPVIERALKAVEANLQEHKRYYGKRTDHDSVVSIEMAQENVDTVREIRNQFEDDGRFIPAHNTASVQKEAPAPLPPTAA